MTAQAAAIVIPALDEAANLGALLDDCRAQVPPPAAVVVVDAGSTDGTAELVAERASGWPELELVRLEAALPGRARNAGIARAPAGVVALVDAGSRIGPGWLAALAQAVGSDPRRVAVGVAEADAHSAFEQAAGWFTLRGFKPPDRPGPVGREFLPAGRNGLCLHRSLWEAAGGYDEELAFSEDKRFLQRLRAAGGEVVVAPAAVVRWRPRGSLAAVFRQYRGYGYGDGLTAIDRQNELVPLGLWAVGSALAARPATRRPAALLAAAYLGLFTVAAGRELGWGRAVAWVPAIRVAVDVAKVIGFIRGSLRRVAQRGAWR